LNFDASGHEWLDLILETDVITTSADRALDHQPQIPTRFDGLWTAGVVGGLAGRLAARLEEKSVPH
jgi:hypothetical protein